MVTMVELAFRTGPWAIGAVFAYLLLKALIDKGFKIEVPPGKKNG